MSNLINLQVPALEELLLDWNNLRPAEGTSKDFRVLKSEDWLHAGHWKYLKQSL